jgi:anti-sigma factor ChrR (cupin superfamily)
MVRRVGNRFRIAHHSGVENDFAGDFSFSAESGSFQNGSVLKNENCVKRMAFLGFFLFPA